MTTQQYDIGDMPVVTGTFRLVETDELADPTAITVKVRKPDGTVTVYSEASLSNPSVGIWKFTFPFPLLCDTSRAIGRAYHAEAEGKDYPSRISYLIGPDGRILQAHAKVNPKTYPAEQLARLE